MLNAEKFKNELLEILSENRYIEVDKYDRKIRKCTGNNCPKCMFGITALGKLLQCYGSYLNIKSLSN